MDDFGAKMDDMKLVVKLANDVLGKKLNVISYDNLRGEQRLEMLLQASSSVQSDLSLPTNVHCYRPGLQADRSEREHASPLRRQINFYGCRLDCRSTWTSSKWLTPKRWSPGSWTCCASASISRRTTSIRTCVVLVTWPCTQLHNLGLNCILSK